MRHACPLQARRRLVLGCVTIGGILWLTLGGCGPAPQKAASSPEKVSPGGPAEPPQPALPSKVVPDLPGGQSPASVSPSPLSVPSKPTVPQVVMSQSLRTSCVLWVGDILPGGRLVDLSGQLRTIRDELGERLTVIAFWSAGSTRLARLAGQKLLLDLQEDVARPFASDGVRVLAIHVGEVDPDVKELVEKAGIAFPVLVDPKRAYFALVAKENLPRLYLVDARGKVLWLDLNFTELAGQTREDLLQAIQAALSVESL